MRSASSVLLVIALCTGVKRSHASSSVWRKRERVSGSNDVRCLPTMITLHELLNGRGTCGHSWTIAWREKDSCLTLPHMFLRPLLPGGHRKTFAQSWHTGGTLVAHLALQKCLDGEFSVRFRG